MIPKPAGLLEQGRWRYLTPLALFVVCFVMLMLRNLDPILYPILYGEDSGWAGLILNKGFWYTAFNAREFPVLGDAFLTEIGIVANELLHGRNIVTLPCVLPFVSWTFCAGVAILPFVLFRSFLSLSTRLCLCLFTVLVPLGFENNEVLGRILNLGFFFPVIAAYIVVWALLEPGSLRRQLICIATLVVCVLTLPISFGFGAVYGAAYAWGLLPTGPGKANARLWSVPILAMAALTATLVFFPKDILSGKGGAALPARPDEWIEFVGARLLLFPLVAPEYKSLTDGCVMVMALSGTVGLLGALAVIGRRKLVPVVPLAAALAMFLVYGGGMAVQRRGLSALLDHYHGTGPDRYYSGTEILSVFGLLAILDAAARMHRLRFLALAGPLLILNLLLAGSPIFEYGQPSVSWRQSGTFAQMFTREACPETSVFRDHPEWLQYIYDSSPDRRGGDGHLVPTYPIVDGPAKYEWAIKVPPAYFDHTVKALKIHCQAGIP